MDDIHIQTEFPRKVREIENTWIPMPDGTNLAARIWLPQDAEADPVPAVLEYLPYRKRDGTVERDQLTHPYFAGHGYAAVRVDMRGTGDSEGVCLGEYLQQEQDDALAVIEWLARQPWCSGKVGMIGISWGGFNGLQVASRRPSALGAIVSLCSTDDRYADDIHFMGGCVLTDKLSWGATAFSIANTPPDPAIVGDRWRDMWLERLENNGLWMLDWFRHQHRDDFYSHGSVCENYAGIEVPVYMVGGWADGYTNAIFRTLEHLPGPKKGLIGPWAHKYPHFARPGPRIGFLQECLRWWDQHLKGVPTGIMDEPMLRAWIQDPAEPAAFRENRDGRWVTEPRWHGKAIETMALFPASTRLERTPSQVETVIRSPQNTGWTAGAWCGYGLVPDGPLDQNGELGLMHGFETEPFGDGFDLLGFPMLHAEVISDAPQANLVASLSVVDSLGRATLISYGVLNLTHRTSHAAPKAMPVGTAQPVSVQLNSCGQRIAKGERLRLSLATSYWPVIWPSQTSASLILLNPKLVLPLRPTREEDKDISRLDAPECAEPLAIERISPSQFERYRKLDFVTGKETIVLISDSGAEKHPHTGLTLQHQSRETFGIHPEDPTSATGTICCRRAFCRDDGWKAEVETLVSVDAQAGEWRIEATLTARDADGLVAERKWSEGIPRNLV